jgi:hypothetical protein
MRKSNNTGLSTLASRTSPSKDQSLQKSFHLSYPYKIELTKIYSNIIQKAKLPVFMPVNLLLTTFLTSGR